MAIKITEKNVSTAVPCEPECPNNAIYEGGVEWIAVSDGTTVKVLSPSSTVRRGCEPEERPLYRYLLHHAE